MLNFDYLDLESSPVCYDWELMTDTFDWLRILEAIPQDPEYHGEGNVLIHVKMVLDALINQDSWSGLTDVDKMCVFVSALMHDVGKAFCTKQEHGRITARNHSSKGASLSRILMWKGIPVPVPFKLREHITGLIRLHSLPLWLYEKENPERSVIRASQSVNLKLLSILAEADVKGRVCNDGDELLGRIELFRDEARRCNCFDNPYRFDSPEARFFYFEKDHRSPHYIPKCDFKSEVVLMAGLPGSGKDFWIETSGPDYPVISLDELRQNLNVSPHEKQHRVISAAKEKAREFLRSGGSFIWNATNITKHMRKQLIDLCVAYNARVKIVYVEPEYDVLIRQNRERADAVPDDVLDRLLMKLDVPAVYEAHDVEYIMEI